jgi:DNA primase
MRAIARGLPLLRPAHSLKIARLPPGLDPDDLIKQQGTAAMEAQLTNARSLIEVLWEHERDAVQLSTPEDKAGLKARLMAHVETIADRDIQSLYRRELLERFSEFAFPRRDNRDWRKPASPARAPTRIRRMQPGDALSAAVLTGLLRFPDQIRRHAEVLGQAGLADPRFDILLDAADSAVKLEKEVMEPILAERGMAAPTPEEYSAMRFGFLADAIPPEQARSELAQAIGLLIERPALEAALKAATTRFESDLSEGAYAEQQRLLKRKLEFDARLRQMASARAGAA